MRRQVILLVAFLAAIAVTALTSQPSRAADARVTYRNPACYSADTAPTGSLAGITAQAPLGVYLWLDPAGWHIRVTHPGSETETFTGQILACSPIQVATGKTYTTRDQAALGGDTNISALAFKLVNTGGLDGFEFNANCPTTWTYSFQLNGEEIPASEINVGAVGVHPTSSTFALPSCASSSDPGVGLNLRGGGGAATGSGVAVGSLQQVALLSLAQSNLNYKPLVLPAVARRLFGDPAAPAALVTKTRTAHGFAHSLVPSLVVALEVGLGLLLLGAWLFARRERRSAA